MTSEFSVHMNEYLPLRDVVFNTLRQAILKGELKPGERLMEIALAERLGVSRTPIREAMRKLELEGLVVMIPRQMCIRDSLDVFYKDFGGKEEIKPEKEYKTWVGECTGNGVNVRRGPGLEYLPIEGYPDVYKRQVQ